MYGGIVYQLLGDKAETAFAHDWGVGLAMDQASQWQARVVSGVRASGFLRVWLGF